MFKSIATYCKESYDELVHKVTWPTRKELINSAVIVLSASIVIAIVVWLLDSVFKMLTDLVYKFF